MRIVIDAYQASATVTGTDRLAANMLRELTSMVTEHELIVITNADHPFVLPTGCGPNVSVVAIRTRSRFLWLLTRLPFLLRTLRADVFFSFHNFAGPIWSPCPTVCSTLDTIPFRRPDLYFGTSPRIKRVLVTGLMRRAIRRAAAVVAISDYTKHDVASVLGIDVQRIVTVALQADPRFFEPRRVNDEARVVDRYRLPPSFVFALGGSEPRKNVDRLVDAHRLLTPEQRAATPLVLGGAPWHGRATDAHGDDPHVRQIGFIDEADLPTVFRLATVFAFPSLAEGFGLTVLEAMASGTAVVASNTTSIPEVAGAAALLVDPTDIADIAAAMSKLLDDEELRSRLVVAGHERCRQFSWERAAHVLIGVLTRAAGQAAAATN